MLLRVYGVEHIVHVAAAQHKDVGIKPVWHVLSQVHGRSVADELDKPFQRRKPRCHDEGGLAVTNDIFDATRMTANS